MYFLSESIFEKRDWPMNSQRVFISGAGGGGGGSELKQVVAFLSLKKEANSAEPATFWEEWESLYIVSSLASAALGSQWSRAETMVAYWGSNTATQEILIIAAPPAFFSPSIVAREQVSQTPDLLGCVCGISGWGGCRSGCAGRNLGVILLICTWGAFSFPSW